MITNFEKFKLFESSDTAKHELVHEFLDNGYALEYYDEHYLSNYNENDIIEIIEYAPSTVSEVFDDEKYIKDYIKEEISGHSIDDFDTTEYKEYIENHLTSEKENKIIEFYYDNNSDEDMVIKTEYDGKVSIIEEDGTTKVVISEGDSTEEYEIPDGFTIVVEDGDDVNNDSIIAKNDDIEYESYMINDLDSDQLKDVITDDYEEGEFLEETIKRRHENMNFIEIMSELGNYDTYEELINNITPRKFYEYYGKYIDKDRLIELYKLNENDDTKYQWVESQIGNSIEIQQYLMDNSSDSNNLTLLLFEIFEYKGDHMDDISDEYDFQKRYIKEYVEENGYGDGTEEETEKLIAEALNELNSNFRLDSDIKKEFNKYMYIVTTNKFNM